MSEITFVIKTFALSIVLIMAMQIKVGNTTLEEQAETWVHDSKIAKFLQAVADGMIKISKNGTQAISVYFKIDETKPVSAPGKTQKASK